MPLRCKMRTIDVDLKYCEAMRPCRGSLCRGGKSFGSLHELSCCARWRRNNALTSTSCPATVDAASSVSASQSPKVWRRPPSLPEKGRPGWLKAYPREKIMATLIGYRVGNKACPPPPPPYSILLTAPRPDYYRRQMPPFYGSCQDYLVVAGGAWRGCQKEEIKGFEAEQTRDKINKKIVLSQQSCRHICIYIYVYLFCTNTQTAWW